MIGHLCQSGNSPEVNRNLDSGVIATMMLPPLLLSACTFAGVGATGDLDDSQAGLEVPWQTDNQRVNDLVTALTPEEKVSLVHHTMWSGTENFAGYINAVPRLGIPALQMTDGEA